MYTWLSNNSKLTCVFLGHTCYKEIKSKFNADLACDLQFPQQSFLQSEQGSFSMFSANEKVLHWWVQQHTYETQNLLMHVAATLPIWKVIIDLDGHSLRSLSHDILFLARSDGFQNMLGTEQSW